MILPTQPRKINNNFSEREVLAYLSETGLGRFPKICALSIAILLAYELISFIYILKELKVNVN